MFTRHSIALILAGFLVTKIAQVKTKAENFLTAIFFIFIKLSIVPFMFLSRLPKTEKKSQTFIFA